MGKNHISAILSLDNITKNRGSLMGFAILWVFLFHVGGIGVPYLDNILLKGYLGVDIFFFLSGWGLCHSLQNKPNTLYFFKRRLARVIPSWWIIIVAMAFLQILMHLPHPSSLLDWILYLSGLGYFFQDFFDGTSLFVKYYEWYVPTLLLFYLFAPILAKCKVIINLCLLGVSIFLIVLVNLLCFKEQFCLSYVRFPVYVLGFICCKLNSCSNNEKYISIGLFFFLFGCLVFVLSNLNVIIHNEFIAVLLMIPVFLSFVSVIFCKIRVFNVLAFFGKISLEFYLLHIYNRLFKILGIFVHERIFALCITFLILTTLSYSISKLSGFITQKLIVK